MFLYLAKFGGGYMTSTITTMDVLEHIEELLEDKEWKNKILNYIEETKTILNGDTYTLNLLERFNWLIARNRTYETKRVVEQEKNNLLGITEQICKLRPINKGYCKVCKNLNCNLNEKKEN